MLTNDPTRLSEGELAERRRASRRYWDAHPISTDAVTHEPGSPTSFDAIYARWAATSDAGRREFLESCRGKRVLEVGCGIAIDGRVLAEHGADYHGLDHSRRSLALAQKNFAHGGRTGKLVCADATRLPFADGEFDLVMSIGVLHHVPGIGEACREVVRVLRPGGSVRIMLYGRGSWHYALVRYGAAPLIRLTLALPWLEPLVLGAAPGKFRELYAICRESGYSRERVLATSADTSSAGADNAIPVSGFFTEREMQELFPGLADCRFSRKDLKYYPFPFLRKQVESRWGFFVTMTAQKPLRPPAS